MTYWLLSRQMGDDWFPCALYRTNDAAITAGLAWEKAGYAISIKPVSVAEEGA